MENGIIEFDDSILPNEPSTSALRQPKAKDQQTNGNCCSIVTVAGATQRTSAENGGNNHKISSPTNDGRRHPCIERKTMRLSLHSVQFGTVAFKVHGKLTITDRQLLLEVSEIQKNGGKSDTVHWSIDYERCVERIEVCFDDRLAEPLMFVIGTEECNRMILESLPMLDKDALKGSDRQIVMLPDINNNIRRILLNRLKDYFASIVEPSLKKSTNSRRLADRSLLHEITFAEAQERVSALGLSSRRSEGSLVRNVSASSPTFIELGEDANSVVTPVCQKRTSVTVNRTPKNSDAIRVPDDDDDDTVATSMELCNNKKSAKKRNIRSLPPANSRRQKLDIEMEPIDLFDDDDQVDVADGSLEAGPSSSIACSAELLVYPSEELGAVTIRRNDLASLNDGEYLNDIIVDFYLKYIVRELLSDQRRNRVHVFPCFFWHRLTIKPTIDASLFMGDQQATKSKIAMASKYHHVRSWTKNVDVFEKDFLIVPINERQHWYLAIVCSPFLVTPNVLENDSEQYSTMAPPCVLIIDSLQETASNRYKAAAVLKDYLQLEWNDKRGAQCGEINRSLLKGIYPLNVPQQDNYSDCGIFMLEYARCFLVDPPSAALLSSGRNCDFAKWYPTFSTANKRTEIRDLIQMKRQILLESTAVDIDYDESHQ